MENYLPKFMEKYLPVTIIRLYYKSKTISYKERIRNLTENIRDVFDIRFAPFCFVVSADGTVESSYKSISEL